MEKITTQPKMSKINLDSMFFEIILSMKGDSYRARSSSLSKIPNIKDARPESSSKYSYENAIQKLIPKIENSLSVTTKQLCKIFQSTDGKVMFSVDNIIYETQPNSVHTDSVNLITSVFIDALKNLLPVNNDNLKQVSEMLTNNALTNNISNETEEKIIRFQDVTVEWQKTLLERTKKDYEDDLYLSPTTLESYSRNLRSLLFPYLEKHPEYDNIKTFSESNIDEILNMTKCKDTKRVLLLCFNFIFNYAIEKSYITINPIANKKLKKNKKQTKKTYDFIEDDQRALWINCMIKEINSKEFEKTDAALAFLFALLHGTRPEETCGVRWMDLNFSENNYHVQNAYKNIPIYDEKTMKRIGWRKGDGPLKTPESYRHLPLDVLAKQLLLEHRIKQMYLYRKQGKKWSEKEYVFLNTTGTPFTPDILSKNFTKFVRRNNLPHIVIYGLRHSFATHCRNLGMNPEVLAVLMGHTEFETTQKYYIHVSTKQKREELQKVQQQDMISYLGEENKDLTHLQNNVNQYNKQNVNLQEVQKEDMIYYLKLNDKTLNILKDLILKVNEKEKIVA